MRPKALAPLVLVVLAAGCAASPEAPSPVGAPDARRACLYTDRIVNFATDNDRRLYVRTQRDGVFALTGSTCLDVDGAWVVRLRPAFGGTARLCPGDQAEVLLPERTFGPNPCRARLDRRLTEAEVEALPSRSRP